MIGEITIPTEIMGLVVTVIGIILGGGATWLTWISAKVISIDSRIVRIETKIEKNQ